MSNILDLKHKTCPETFLFTKMALEDCPAGTSLEVRYANEETAQRVRSSLSLEGFEATIVARTEAITNEPAHEISKMATSTDSQTPLPECSLKISIPKL